MASAARFILATMLQTGFATLPGTAGAEVYHWLQYGPAGLEARAITDQAACPTARIGGLIEPMTVRAMPSAQFPVTVCALAIPTDGKSVTISDVPLAKPVAEPRRILVIGDTGCRMKGPYVQACNDPVQWPFRLVAEVAAQLKPDLVIHVGDYHYRETSCPEGDPGCAGSPSGDTWAAWRADFFAPADTLLKVAPWVFVRGNHEECDRGGQGWSRAIDPYAFEARGCNGLDKPFAAKLQGLTLAVMDVSSAREDQLDEAQMQTYREHYASLATLTEGPTWLLQHRPIWSAGGLFGGKPVGNNRTLAPAAEGLIPANVSLMLSGHHHLFQVLTYQSDLPPQVVVGHGGDYLNGGPSLDPAGWNFDGVIVKSGLDMVGSFGFAMFERQLDGWRVTNYDKLGAARKTCTLKGRAATC